MIVLDTNVISERLSRVSDPNVTLWLDAQPADELYLCTPVVAEMQFGVARLVPSARKRGLQEAISRLASEVFSGRLLTFDLEAALDYGTICADREALGRPIAPVDAMIAAIARSNSAKLATRNVSDFAETGLDLVNPFEHQ